MRDKEIEIEVDRLQKQLYELRAQAVTEKLENPRVLPQTRRDMARLLTERRARQIKAAAGES
jgi:ribosomal protein L29